ncbi:MAG: nucleotide sugar dehydrogenase [Balneolaceae bacterium]
MADTKPTKNIGIIGLGYVGLPLLKTFHDVGHKVYGFDIDIEKIEKLRRGESYIKHFSNSVINILKDSKKCHFENDFSYLSKVDYILICVPTPLGLYREPNMSYVEETAKVISNHIRKGQLVILESTTWPGTTDELVTGIIEEGSGLISGEDFFMAYSPEREDPGNPDFHTRTIPKVVGASTKKALELSIDLYSSAIDSVVPVSSARVAESAKLLENIFRSVNIALVNEMKVVMDSMDIDIHEVIDAAATKPFGFMKFTPGPGLGGHCIPIDPFYLTWKAKEFGLNTRFIELAGEVNAAMPQFVIDKTILALNSHGKPVKGSTILVLGIAYKPDVDDMRESPSFLIMDKLEELGAEVSYHDSWIPEIPRSRNHLKWMGEESVIWREREISAFDCVVLVTDHKNVNYQELHLWNDCIVDSRNAMKEFSPRHSNHIFKA